jgi:hypothetical protein
VTAPAAEPFHLDRRAWRALGTLAALALALRIGVAVALPSVAHPDEVFQYLEAAHRWAFGYGVETWEYRIGTRSWLLPGLIGIVMRIADALAPSPEGYVVATQAVLAAASLAVVATAFLWGLRTHGQAGAVVAGGCAALWCDLVFFAAKPLTEVLAGHLLVPALYLVRFVGERSARRFAVAGVLFGLVLVLRIHLAPAIGVAALYAARGEVRGRWLPMAAGGAAVVVLAGLLDRITWSYPFQAQFLNFWVNVVEGKANQFGVEKWTWYAAMFAHVWAWAIVPMAAALLVARREALLVLVALAILVAHSAVAHKEYRFLFPLIPIAVLLFGLGTAEAVRRLATARPAAFAAAALAAWAATSFAVAQRPAFASYFEDFAWKMQVFARLGRMPDLCGLALFRVHFTDTPGYTWLHRDVPIIVIESAADIPRLAPFANYVLTDARSLPADPAYAVQACRDPARFRGLPGKTLCLLRRPGACTAPAENGINDYLRRMGL